MTGNALSIFLGNMATQLPVLLVYAAGLVAAAIFLRRHPRPAALTLAGTALLLLVTVIFSLTQAYLIEARTAAGRTVMDTAWLLSASGMVYSCLRAVGLGLILLAVFSGRRPLYDDSDAPWPESHP